ncbi:MAG TPA: c-type cytochrome [Acidobacteriota bacterium]|nr:c-type cytochrome [Acidobacteriota bacterium]
MGGRFKRGRPRRPRQPRSGHAGNVSAARAKLLRPEVLILLVAVCVAVAGWWLIIEARQEVPVREAEIGGLRAHLQGTRWLVDQMDHGENFAKPSTMMPDMPDHEHQRLSAELTFRTVGPGAEEYRGEEFTLVSSQGNEYPPVGAQLGSLNLGSGQTLNTAIYFDFDSSRDFGSLKLRWRRDGEEHYMPVPHPPAHYHARPTTTEWPRDITLLLPLARPERGRQHFSATYGCSACHGDPSVPDSNNVGPHLGAIARQAAQRVEGLSAAQYIYQSILDPNEFISPECRDGQPCTEPSAMPEYSGILTAQAMADIVAYLLSQTSQN